MNIRVLFLESLINLMFEVIDIVVVVEIVKLVGVWLIVDNVFVMLMY